MKGEQHPHHGDDNDGTDNDPTHGHIALDAAGSGGVPTFRANVFQAGAQSGNDGGQGAQQRDQAGGSDSTRTHGANVAAPNIVGSHLRNGNCGWIDRRIASHLPVKLDSGHHHQPGNDAAGEENAGDPRADDVADPEIFRSDIHAKACTGEPAWAPFGLFRPREDGFHQEGVDAAEAESPEDASGKGAATLARYEHVGAGRAFGKRQVAVFFHDKLAAQRNHEEYAEPSAEKRKRKNTPEGEFGAEAEKDQRGNGEHHTGGERFSRGAGGLHDVVFEDSRAAERAQDADGENGDGNRGGDGEAGT